MIKLISVFCDDLRKIKHFECCKGCHEASDKGLLELAIANLKHEGQSVFAHGCCRSDVCRLKAKDLGPAVAHRKKTILDIDEQIRMDGH